MKIRSVSSLDSQMSHSDNFIMIDARHMSDNSIQSNMTNLRNMNEDFWKLGNCKIHIKILHDDSEAIIELGDEFKIMPSSENIKMLKEIFGDETVKLNK